MHEQRRPRRLVLQDGALVRYVDDGTEQLLVGRVLKARGSGVIVERDGRPRRIGRADVVEIVESVADPAAP